MDRQIHGSLTIDCGETWPGRSEASVVFYLADTFEPDQLPPNTTPPDEELKNASEIENLAEYWQPRDLINRDITPRVIPPRAKKPGPEGQDLLGAGPPLPMMNREVRHLSKIILTVSENWGAVKLQK
jgi:hypothetical protein